jgi:hypothetical protein
MILLWLLLGGIACSLLGLSALRVLDARDDRAQWRRLAALQPADPVRFDRCMVEGLPEPARRFFGFAIAPGTPLLTVAELHMGGEFSLGPPDRPVYQPMDARQILAAPEGFLWTLRLPNGVSGSDFGSPARGWTRFRIFGLVPVARLGGARDHTRAAFGRYVAEAVFWTPAALLPRPGVNWEALGEDAARVTVSAGDLSQAVDVRLDAEGRPLVVEFQRWSDANPERRYRLQPFGGFLSDFREVQGFRVPFSVEAGSMFGTEAYFPFFRARLKSVRFPPSPHP